MIDLETLGTRPDCVVLTIGAVKFDPRTKAEPAAQLYRRFNVDQQQERGRSIDDATLEWWSKQSQLVQEEALGDHDRQDVGAVLDELTRFLVGVDNIWAQGAVFDIAILENLYRQFGRPCPWNFWQISDSRTLFKAVPVQRDKDRADLHNALADAITQARDVQRAYAMLSNL